MRILLVDMYSGSYTEKNIGHEYLNFVENNGRYYGHVPPDDKVDIVHLGANKKDSSINGILVVYVTAISKNDRRRKIIAYSKNATVYCSPQSGQKVGRTITQPNGKVSYVSYSIKSDNLTEIFNYNPQFIIEIKKYNLYMFRKQRSYLEKYPNLEQEILNYIEILEGNYHTLIQSVQAATPTESAQYSNLPDEIVYNSYSEQIRRNPAIGKMVIENNNYECNVCKSHITFTNKSGKPYMEAHHVIPCTVPNSNNYKNRSCNNHKNRSCNNHKNRSKLDREENIVSLCPNCHRAVHYGNDITKSNILKIIYNKQIKKLKSAGLNINFNDLLKLYM